jgi:N-methylhydantoinase A
MGYRIGVDIGGTFIDFCLFNEASGDLRTLKVLTTPATPGAEVMQGLKILESRDGVPPADILSFVHGTTVGINTVIQRKGAALALFTTRNFEDVIELARLRMPESYSLFSRRPDPLVPKDMVFGIGERMLADGTVDEPLDEASVAAAIARARAKGAQGIVVSFLNSYRNPAHEEAAQAIVRRLAPDLFVFRSSEVWPVIREYERTTTVLINGYIHPRVDLYLSSLQKALADHGVPAEPLLTKSNGGVMSAEIGKSNCVSMVLSGTASGVMGAAWVAAEAGVRNAITLDIGGTSADVALIMDGEPQFGMGEKIGELPLYIPSVSVTSIGDGGGSVAWVDGFGVLKVGPESAGSDPGPACYGKGGTRATITDAFAVCGFIGHHQLAYNSVTPDIAKARAAVSEIAGQVGLGLRETAEAIIRIAISGMFMEINKLVARYGVDARDFTLLPFGGAGPMLGCFLARELGVERVLIPTTPGVVSALGGLIADVKNDFIRTVFVDAEPEQADLLRGEMAALEAQGARWLREEQHFDGQAEQRWSCDMSYKGQSFEIEVPVEKAWIRGGDMAAVTAAFHDVHERMYDFCDRTAPAHIVNLRLVVAGSTPKPRLRPLEAGGGAPVPEKMLEVFYDGGEHTVPPYRRADLRAGHRFAGPCVVAQDDSTACVPGGLAAEVDALGNIFLTRSAGRS